MGYRDYLNELLAPMRLYDLKSGPGAAELEALGAGLDGVFGELTAAEREMLPPTAENAGLEKLEAILPYHPRYITLADRRRAIMALMRIDDCAFTPAALNDTLSGCGIKAVVEETSVPMTVKVSFPDNRGVPADFQALKERIDSILPCHLAVDYFIIYITWSELESWFSSWAYIESLDLSWDALERYAR